MDIAIQIPVEFLERHRKPKNAKNRMDNTLAMPKPAQDCPANGTVGYFSPKG